MTIVYSPISLLPLSKIFEKVRHSKYLTIIRNLISFLIVYMDFVQDILLRTQNYLHNSILHYLYFNREDLIVSSILYYLNNVSVSRSIKCTDQKVSG